MLTRKPVSELGNDVLVSRYQSLLHACRVKDLRFLVPTFISDAFHETRIEVERRGISPDIGPSIINTDDPDPINHDHSIVRYLEEPYLSQFLSGTISLGHAKDCAADPNPARKDDEQKRMFMHPNQVVTIGEIKYPTSDIEFKIQILGDDCLPLSYHFVSFSTEESVKLARAFGTDGCVIIKDPSKFFDLLEKEIIRRYPKADVSRSNVTYYDPLAGNPSRKTPYDLLSRKTIDYYFQHEVRIIVEGADGLDDRLNLQISPPEGLFQLRKFAWPN